MLTRLYCHNYKCLDNFEFRPAQIQLLLGRNGGGKSTVFEVLALLRDFAVRGSGFSDEQGRFQVGGGTRTRWQDRPEQRFELDVSGNGGLYRYEVLVDEWGKPAAPRIRKEALSFDGRILYLFENGMVHLHNDQGEDRSQFAIAPRRSYLSEIEARPENTKLMWFKHWLDRMLCVQVVPAGMSGAADKEAPYPSPDLANFAAWYRHLRQDRSAATDELRASLEGVFDGFNGLDLKGPPGGTRELQMTVRVAGGDGARPREHQYAFAELSDGQRALIALYTLLHCALADPTTLCLDEPDNFVALGEIQPWLMQMIDRAQETGSQLLIASHHPELLNQLAARDGVILDRDDGGPTRVRPFAPPADSTLSAAEVVARGWEHA